MMRMMKAPKRDVYLMEICGTHTMAIAKAGIRQCLPANVHLISGPGCPVCVTPASAVDAACALVSDPSFILCSYGDMLRVPGSERETLLQKRAQGFDVRICLSVMDALEIARTHPQKEVVFLAVGFETTAPGTAVALREAKRTGLKNFSVYCLMKRTKEVINAILRQPDCRIDGFLCPGHVAAIIGEEGFRFLTREHQKSGVICGFSPQEILYGLQLLLGTLEKGEAAVYNAYTSVVRSHGNPRALALIDELFEREDALWRGLGVIKGSGMALREEYRAFDAAKRFALPPLQDVRLPGCACGEVIAGKKRPAQCRLFRSRCTPRSPYGPCMVSQEGACAAAYQYE